MNWEEREEEKKIMGQILKQYPSRSNPSKNYEVIRGADGKTYCTCWPWKLNRTCEHLEDYLGHQKQYKIRKQTVAGKVDTYLDLEKAIAQAVRELS
jgi:hypothetical protein